MRLDDCLTRAAGLWPDRAATCYRGKWRTWQQVYEDVLMLAAGLRTLGVAAGDRVAMLAGNSDRYLDCFFATAWLGALTVPLNTRLKRNELAACLRDSGAEVLLTDGIGPDNTTGLVGDLPGLRQVIHIGDGPVPEGLLVLGGVTDEGACERVSGGGELVAGIFYTAGTTGAPKGVVLTHDNLLANAWHLLPSLGWSSDTVFLHATPMFHAAGICCLVAVSVVAGRHVILPRFDAEDVIGAVGEHGVTALGLVSAMVNALTIALDGRPLPTLSTMLCGGSPMAEELITRTRQALPQVRLWQAYEQTEAASTLTLLAPERHEPGPAGRPRSAGLPVLGCQITVRDPVTGAELSRGQVGEICGRGDNVMSGYWGKPELTAKTLRDGWLHTGDAGYLDGDGFLYVTGRLDDMIITGSENVFPAEVENVICQHPAVAEVAVIGVPDDHRGQRIHAVLVLQLDHELEIDGLLEFCRERLAGYKCPRTIEIRGMLPKTGAGKVDKKLLVPGIASG